MKILWSWVFSLHIMKADVHVYTLNVPKLCDGENFVISQVCINYMTGYMKK